MADKVSISSSYMDAVKATYYNQTIPSDRRILIIGDNRNNNIGAGISQVLRRDYNALIHSFIKEEIDLLLAEERAEISWGDYDTVIFCNGHSYMDWIENVPDGEIDQVIGDCLTASIKGSRDFIRATMDRPVKKHIVFIGSMAYKATLNGSATYCAAKAGLSHFTKCIGWELAPKGFDVFCVHPSNTEGTPMTEETIAGLMRYRGLSREDAEGYWGAVLPKAQWLSTKNIGDVVSFLISGKAEYLSGTNLDLTGGQR